MQQQKGSFTSVWQVNIGGADTGQIIVTSHRESREHIEKPTPKKQKIFNKIFASDGPVNIVGRDQVDILSQTGNINGHVAWIAYGNQKPGRVGEYVAQLDKITKLLMRHGAQGVAHYSSYRLAVMAYYRDLSAWAVASEQARNDPAVQRLVDEITGAEGPIVAAGEQLWRRLL